MIVSVHVVKPHPDQSTHNPGCWAVQLCVSHAGKTRTFWRWHTVQERIAGCYVTPTSEKEPSTGEILSRFWDDTFGDLHGFDFECLEGAP